MLILTLKDNVSDWLFLPNAFYIDEYVYYDMSNDFSELKVE